MEQQDGAVDGAQHGVVVPGDHCTAEAAFSLAQLNCVNFSRLALGEAVVKAVLAAIFEIPPREWDVGLVPGVDYKDGVYAGLSGRAEEFFGIGEGGRN